MLCNARPSVNVSKKPLSVVAILTGQAKRRLASNTTSQDASKRTVEFPQRKNYTVAFRVPRRASRFPVRKPFPSRIRFARQCSHFMEIGDAAVASKPVPNTWVFVSVEARLPYLPRSVGVFCRMHMISTLLTHHVAPPFVPAVISLISRSNSADCRSRYARSASSARRSVSRSMVTVISRDRATSSSARSSRTSRS